MSPAKSKGCTVAWAGAQQQLWSLTLGAEARIADALAAARAAAGDSAAAQLIPWDTAPVGIFGELRQRSDGFADGDRIELYRPLSKDPRERGRAGRAARGRS